jgi:hypothetical protein
MSPTRFYSVILLFRDPEDVSAFWQCVFNDVEAKGNGLFSVARIYEAMRYELQESDDPDSGSQNAKVNLRFMAA